MQEAEALRTLLIAANQESLYKISANQIKPLETPRKFFFQKGNRIVSCGQVVFLAIEILDFVGTCLSHRRASYWV